MLRPVALPSLADELDRLPLQFSDPDPHNRRAKPNPRDFEERPVKVRFSSPAASSEHRRAYMRAYMRRYKR